MKYLSFEFKRNLNRAPRIHVRSHATGGLYGSFPANEPEAFDAWENMTNDEAIELKSYMNNLKAINKHIGSETLNQLTNYRLRLPKNFIEAIDEINLLCNQSSLELDVFEPMITAMVQELKIMVSKLKGENKTKALTILDHLGLAEYKKIDHNRKIQAIFAEILPIHKKSEKLHKQAKMLFDKDKSYSPKAIEGMTKGDSVPSRWLVSCGIVLLLEEKRNCIDKILSHDDLFILFAKPLIDHNKKKECLALLAKYKLSQLKSRVEDFA